MAKETDSNLSKTQAKAIALEYQNPDSLPKVIVSGKDELARLIIEIARNAEIPIERNTELVELLEKQRAGPIISEKALKILAEVIAFLYQSDYKLSTQSA